MKKGNYPEISAFAEHLGFEMVERDHGKIVLSMVPEEFTKNRTGGVHGGVVCALLDTALGLAASTVSSGSEVVTVTLDVSFVAASKGRLIATGSVVKGGRSLIFCRGDVVDSTDTLVAVGSATMKIVRPHIGNRP